MITAVIFDLDDTLYREVDYCKSGFTAVAHFLADIPDSAGPKDYNIIFDALWAQFSAGNHTSTFNAAMDRLGIDYDRDTIQNLISIYRNHTPRIELPPESGNVLDLLYPKYKLALLTDGFLPAQQLKVRALGIEKYFAAVIYTEQLGRQFWKPSPEGFRRILRQLDEKPQKCVYLGDNAEKDFIAPNMLGLQTVQLTLPEQVHKAPAPGACAGASHIITSISQLPGLLDTL